MTPTGGQRALALLAALMAAVYALVYRIPALTPLGPLRNLAATLLVTPLYAGSGMLASHAQSKSRSGLFLVIVGWIALRTSIPLGLVEGSNDAYRYLWDGRVQAAGLNPYAHPPEAPELAHLRDGALYPQIFRPDMRTVYPPVGQLWFRLAHAIGGDSFVGLKLIYLLHEGLALLLLALLLRRRGRPVAQALLYAWSPLAVVQGYAGLHLDLLLVPWLLLALLWVDKRPLWAGFALGLSALVRPVTLLCAPALALRRRWRQTALVALGTCAICALFITPYLDAGGGLTESLQTYAQHWYFNASLYRGVRWLWADLGHLQLRPLLYLAIATGAVAIGLLRARTEVRMLLALGIYLAFAPTVYPWYFIAPIALGALVGGPLFAAMPALVTLSDLVFVQGAVGGSWAVPAHALWLEYVGLYALLAWAVLRSRRPQTHRANP